MAYIGTEPIPPIAGGTGVANANTSTLTLGGSLALIGAFTTQFHLTNNTNVTFPTSGVLATTSVPGGGTGTNTFTQYSVLLGNGISAISSVGPSATTGAPLISAGSSANPTFSTIASILDATGQLLVSTAVVGGVSQLSLVNTDNSNASSGARVTIQSGGTSAGDAYVQRSCGDVASTWQAGVQNSSNSYLINQGSTVGTALMTGTTTMSITSAGAVTIPAGDLTVSRSNSGSAVQVASVNTSNTASSVAVYAAQIAGTTALGAYFNANISGDSSKNWSMGVLGSDGNWYLHQDSSSTFGTNPYIKCKTTGEITMPKQSSFSATVSTTVANVTGDATNYQVIFDSEQTDQNADYNNSTGVFTAPVTGNYLFCCTVMASNVGVAHTTGQLFLFTTANNYLLQNLFIGIVRNAGNFYSMTYSVIVPMAATDTANVRIIASGSTKTVGVAGNDVAFGASTFSGQLIS